MKPGYLAQKMDERMNGVVTRMAKDYHEKTGILVKSEESKDALAISIGLTDELMKGRIDGIIYIGITSAFENFIRRIEQPTAADIPDKLPLDLPLN